MIKNLKAPDLSHKFSSLVPLETRREQNENPDFPVCSPFFAQNWLQLVVESTNNLVIGDTLFPKICLFNLEGLVNLTDIYFCSSIQISISPGQFILSMENHVPKTFVYFSTFGIARKRKKIKKKKFTSLNYVVDMQHFFSRKQDQVVQKETLSNYYCIIYSWKENHNIKYQPMNVQHYCEQLFHRLEIKNWSITPWTETKLSVVPSEFPEKNCKIIFSY